jgi:prephenate dehydrogenase
MSVQITVLGLNTLGQSIGLALAPVKDRILRVGSDASNEVMRQAQKNGAFEKTIHNLPEAVRDADAVIFCTPLDELRKTMDAIRQDLKPGVVVLDTSLIPAQSTAWAQELLPAQNCYFLSFTPAINPAYLLQGAGEAAPHTDYFKNASIFLTHPQGIDPSAIEFGDNLARLLGGSPVFADVQEIEGLLAMTRWLPFLAAAAAHKAALGQPGWNEARKLAGPEYARLGQALADFSTDGEAGLGLLEASGNALRMIDLLKTELDELRALITAQDSAALDARIKELRRGNETWLRRRRQADWSDDRDNRPPAPSMGDVLGRLVGIKPRGERKQR